MKTIVDHTMKKNLGLCVLIATLLFASTLSSADVVLDWNTIAVNTAVANKQSPFAQARYAAIVQLAVFEAVNSITSEYQPYLGTITAQPDASPDAAAIEAAYQVLNFYFPNSATALLNAYTSSLGRRLGVLHTARAIRETPKFGESAILFTLTFRKFAPKIYLRRLPTSRN